MSENNEIKWVEVEQVSPEQAAAKTEAPVDAAPAAFNAMPATEETPAAFNAAPPESDPFEVEPKLNKNVYGDNPAESFDSTEKFETVEAEVVNENPFESTNSNTNEYYTYHKEGRGTYQAFDENNAGGGYNAGGSYSNVPPAHQKAVASLVLGIVGLFCCGICGLVGLIFSIQAKNEGNNESIRTAGFVISCVSVGLWVLGACVRMIMS